MLHEKTTSNDQIRVHAHGYIKLNKEVLKRTEDLTLTEWFRKITEVNKVWDNFSAKTEANQEHGSNYVLERKGKLFRKSQKTVDY